jgi:hypothetical protein
MIDPPSRPPLVDRTLVGVLAIVGLLGGAALLLFDSFDNAWGASLLRVGLFLAVFWMALPTKTRPAAWSGISPWTTISLAGFVLLAVRSRKPVVVMLTAIGLAVLAFILRPRQRRQ